MARHPRPTTSTKVKAPASLQSQPTHHRQLEYPPTPLLVIDDDPIALSNQKPVPTYKV